MDELKTLLYNQQQQINNLINVTNMQSQIINNISYKLDSFNNKLSDIQILMQNNDSSISQNGTLLQNLSIDVRTLQDTVNQLKYYYNIYNNDNFTI